MKIRAKLLFGFAAAVAVSAAMGLGAAVGIGRVSDIAGALYDKPLMAADFSRSALENFLRLDRQATAILAEKDAAALAGLPKSLTDLQQAVLDDLAVVVERFPEASGAALVDTVRQAVDLYVKATTELGAAAAKSAAPPAVFAAERAARLAAVDEKFDILVEAAKEQGLNFREAAAEEGARTLRLIEGAIVANLVLGLFIAILLARGIARPITAITATMTRLAGGTTELEIPALRRSDEVGEMAKAVEVFKRNAIESARLEALRLQNQAEKEERAARIASSSAAFDQTISSFIGAVTAAATQMEALAGTMDKATGEAIDQARAAASAAEETAANVQTVASATEELSSSTGEVGQQTAHSATTMARAAEGAALADQRIQALAEMAQKIGHVVELIEQIAGQTNLLALNATIEAARAGEAGKGFAVVASEVKSLATQTARATEEIRAQITEVQGATEATVAAIRGIGATIGEVTEVAARIAAAIEEQGAATREIAGSAQRAAEGTVEVSSHIAGASRLSGEVGAASSQVLGAAGELTSHAARLRQEVETYLATIRAA